MKYLIIILFAIVSSHEMLGQFATVPIASKDRAIICNYFDFVEAGLTEKQKNTREDLYLKLLGVLAELSDYRELFLSKGELIDLFPTAYYHTTLSEIKNIVSTSNPYSYPVDKMKQMLAFYDAYKYNRVTWEFGQYHLVEEHWKVHFSKASRNPPFTNYADLQDALETGIEAHVVYDLPRAIKFAYLNRENASNTASDLLPDFNRTDAIFSTTAKKTNQDIATTSPLYREWVLNFGNFLLNKDAEVKRLRKDSWRQGISSANNGTVLVGYSGNDMAKQPIMSHDSYLAQAGRLCSQSVSSTLFLFDLSGSMNGNGGGAIPKLEQAKQASQSSLRALSANSQGIQNLVAVYGFAGGCSPDPTREFSPFDADLAAVEQRILQMQAGGGTPLSNALEAAKCKMAAHLQSTGESTGKLILLSDGQGTCGAIRPPGVYNSAPLQTPTPRYIDANACGLPQGSPVAVSYYTVGFNIPPGSPAERDLQYLSQSSRGKYLNVQNQTQLTRAFRKFNRVYRPKMNPATNSLSTENETDFRDGVNVILDERFPKALEDWEALATAHPDDCHVIYNLALTQEANDLYREAIDNYQRYLTLCPASSDKSFVTKQISFLEDEFRQFVTFQREVIQSDLAYLELHFKQIQNGQSIRLAEEFKGFLQEKGNYYERLPRMLASNNRFLKGLSEDISSSLTQAAKMIKRNPETWDRDATPIISMTYLNLKDLIEEL